VTFKRITIAKTMVIVAIVALNAAIARALWDRNPEVLIGVAITGLAVEWAFFCFMRGHHRSRAFWLGFALLGSVALGSFVVGMSVPREVVGTAVVAGKIRYLNVSSLSALWMRYATLVSDHLETWLPRFGIGTDLGPVAVISIKAVIWSLPQLFLAIVGGSAVWLLSRMIRIYSRTNRHRDSSHVFAISSLTSIRSRSSNP
jgi:hypothetical protein